MARILYNGDWFEEISSRGHYETEYEKVLQSQASVLFASYHFVPFKTTVVSVEDSDARRPDFALIHKSYRSWWVVEVELGHHSLEGHVFPQVRTLARAKYGQAEADFLCEQRPDLDKAKILEMFKGCQPPVLVVANFPVTGWAERLHPFGARVVVCQIFRSTINRYLFRVNGDFPSESEELVTTCECAPLIHRMLVIHAPTQLKMDNNQRVLLYHEGQASEWERIDTAEQVFLHSVRDHKLQPAKRYEIVRQGNGTLVIRARSKS